MIAPEDCKNLDQIRAGMDVIDKQVIALFAQRVAYVRAAANFKKTAAEVSAPERVQAVLNTRKEWAEQAGLDGDVIQSIYRELVSYCVSEEHKSYK